jgi:hypothetical protein
MDLRKLMVARNVRRICGIGAVSGFIVIRASVLAENAASLDDTPRLLAGLPVTGPLAALAQDSRWQGHAAAMDKAWKTKEYFQLGPIATWMASHASDYGPDFLYAYAFFPDASTYILAGV